MRFATYSFLRQANTLFLARFSLEEGLQNYFSPFSNDGTSNRKPLNTDQDVPLEHFLRVKSGRNGAGRLAFLSPLPRDAPKRNDVKVVSIEASHLATFLGSGTLALVPSISRHTKNKFVPLLRLLMASSSPPASSPVAYLTPFFVFGPERFIV